VVHTDRLLHAPLGFDDVWTLATQGSPHTSHSSLFYLQQLTTLVALPMRVAISQQDDALAGKWSRVSRARLVHTLLAPSAPRDTPTRVALTSPRRAPTRVRAHPPRRAGGVQRREHGERAPRQRARQQGAARGQARAPPGHDHRRRGRRRWYAAHRAEAVRYVSLHAHEPQHDSKPQDRRSEGGRMRLCLLRGGGKRSSCSALWRAAVASKVAVHGPSSIASSSRVLTYHPTRGD
jgi:hypothetical protein